LCQVGKEEKTGKKGERMIVRMKEVWLFTLSSAVDDTLQELGRLGVVEIRDITPPVGEQIDRIIENKLQAETAISILENYTIKNSRDDNRKKYNFKDPTSISERIVNSGDFKKRCQSSLEQLHEQLEWYETWGVQTVPKDLKYLREKGIYVRLYLLDKKYLESLPKDKSLITFPERAGKVPIALVSRSESEKLKFSEEPLPILSYKEIKSQIIRKNRQLENVESFLTDQAENIELLQDYHAYLQDRLNTKKALKGMGEIEGSVKYLKGFIPKDEVDLFKNKAAQKKWGYKIADPENPEEVPVYVKNPKWVSIINPVMKFIDIVPGYKEVDVSIYFLVAFALFFAMLVGDAGYGALFLIITFLLRKKLTAQMRFLIYILSGSTILWGVLSGTYFGSEQIAAIPFLNSLIIPEIASFGVNNIDFMMHLTFLIGAIHLTVAHSIRAVQFINSIKVLSELGWIALVWGLFYVVETLVLSRPMPDWNMWLFIGGASLVALFSKEGKSFFSSMLGSLANLPLSLINGFSDIVSYVRLFAVGMATAMVGSSFNNMILPAGVDLSFLEMVMAAVALLLGHGMNIVLALMAVMVHGIRLNMLEFAGHLGVQFSGEAYQPFILNGKHKKPDDNLEMSRK
jgi:V/A-type H+-transporting ATPase subunit I